MTQSLEERRREQLAILADPFRFAEAMETYLVGMDGPLDTLFGEDVGQGRAHRDFREAARLAEQAIDTPAADLTRAVNQLEEHAFDFAIACVELGVYRGVVVEGVRRLLQDYRRAIEPGDLGKEDEYLARDRARLEELSAGEGERLIALREQFIAEGRLTTFERTGDAMPPSGDSGAAD